MSPARRHRDAASTTVEDLRRVKLRDFHQWLIAQDPTSLAQLAQHADETRLALMAIERWFKDYAEAFKGRGEPPR